MVMASNTFGWVSQTVSSPTLAKFDFLFLLIICSTVRLNCDKMAQWIFFHQCSKRRWFDSSVILFLPFTSWTQYREWSIETSLKKGKKKLPKMGIEPVIFKY
jgi:hypothetical protein